MKLKFLISLLCLIVSLPAMAQEKPLPVDDAFRLKVSQAQAGEIRLEWSIADGYYLYRERLHARLVDGDEIAIVTQAGTEKNDPGFGLTEVYYTRASATITPSGNSPIELTYQGCQDNGICYRPETRLIDPQTLAISGSLGAETAPVLAWKNGRAPESAALQSSWSAPVSPADAFTLSDEKGMIPSLLAKGGTGLLLASFLVFGLLLAFTPCVFPMYPILAGALAREGDRLTPRRGFVLSTIYVVSLASAFAIVGALAGWSGQNLQLVLQSPAMVAAMALIFAVLALSMFGVFELQLPSAWTSWIASRTGGRRGSKRSAAVLGFSSALIVGPCVTAPLAGALLYIAQTADWMLGSAALFALGIGKGIPLIVLGTMGGRVLPRAGVWMQTVRHGFGLGFLATAIWIATPLLPAGLDLVLWAAWLIAIAMLALNVAWATVPVRIVARTVGTLALVQGVILLVGAASGGTDPLKPLGVFASRTTSAAPPALAFANTGSTADFSTRLVDVRNEKPTLVYFTADWCVTCHSIERSVLSDGEVRRQLADFSLIKADLSDLDADNTGLMQALNVAGPPTMIVFDRAGREPAGSRLVGAMSREDLLRSAATVKNGG